MITCLPYSGNREELGFL